MHNFEHGTGNHNIIIFYSKSMDGCIVVSIRVSRSIKVICKYVEVVGLICIMFLVSLILVKVLYA